mmetsp:Transcript_5122/g.17844  ORF Transcript_5122/g.17844 Transcript_5122/m.17844 type:complete len:238 (-) Transcript_5122:1917-2630(-)
MIMRKSSSSGSMRPCASMDSCSAMSCIASLSSRSISSYGLPGSSESQISRKISRWPFSSPPSKSAFQKKGSSFGMTTWISSSSSDHQLSDALQRRKRGPSKMRPCHVRPTVRRVGVMSTLHSFPFVPSGTLMTACTSLYVWRHVILSRMSVLNHALRRSRFAGSGALSYLTRSPSSSNSGFAAFSPSPSPSPAFFSFSSSIAFLPFLMASAAFLRFCSSSFFRITWLSRYSSSNSSS